MSDFPYAMCARSNESIISRSKDVPNGLLAQRHSIKAVSQRLGHASVELTLRVYAHVLPSDDAALADGLDRMYG
jgi:hypothetical protein